MLYRKHPARFLDLIQREGKYPLPPQAPKTLGVEFSGTIESLGAGPHGDFKVGDTLLHATRRLSGGVGDTKHHQERSDTKGRGKRGEDSICRRHK